MEPSTSIGKRIKQLRHSKGLSQVDLAASIGVSKQTLYKYENDIITNIPSDKIEALAKLLDTTPAYIMGWDKREINNVSKALREIAITDQDIAVMALNLNIPDEIITNIINENYNTISSDLLIKIADYFNVPASALLKYNTCRIPDQIMNAISEHDLSKLDEDSALAKFLATIGYELYPDAYSDDKVYTITNLEKNESIELSEREFALFKRVLKRNITDSVYFIRDMQCPI